MKKRIYYEVRFPGDGEFDYFTQNPNCDENGFNPRNKKSALASAKNFGNAWVVKIEETKIEV